MLKSVSGQIIAVGIKTIKWLLAIPRCAKTTTNFAMQTIEQSIEILLYTFQTWSIIYPVQYKCLLVCELYLAILQV